MWYSWTGLVFVMLAHSPYSEEWPFSAYVALAVWKGRAVLGANITSSYQFLAVSDSDTSKPLLQKRLLKLCCGFCVTVPPCQRERCSNCVWDALCRKEGQRKGLLLPLLGIEHMAHHHSPRMGADGLFTKSLTSWWKNTHTQKSLCLIDHVRTGLQQSRSSCVSLLTTAGFLKQIAVTCMSLRLFVLSTLSMVDCADMGRQQNHIFDHTCRHHYQHHH